jgi:hypothetical protein
MYQGCNIISNTPTKTIANWCIMTKQIGEGNVTQKYLIKYKDINAKEWAINSTLDKLKRHKTMIAVTA